MRENAKDKSPFVSSDMVDRLIVDPHGLLDYETYRNFVRLLFHVSISQALSATYSDEDTQPIAFNLMWSERKNQ